MNFSRVPLTREGPRCRLLTELSARGGIARPLAVREQSFRADHSRANGARRIFSKESDMPVVRFALSGL